MSDLRSAGNMNLSREMYTALFKDQEAQRLVDSILKDEKVNLDATDGPSDKAAIEKLRTYLESAALKDDRVLSETELSLLNALDAVSREGASSDVVLRNLQQIQKLQQQVSSGILEPSQIQFELLTQTAAEKRQGLSQTQSVTQSAEVAKAPSTGNEACGVDNTNCDNNFAEEFTRERLLSPTRIEQDKAVKQLQHEAGAVMARIQDPQSVPDTKLRADLNRLADSIKSDPAYTREVLTRIGLSPEVLNAQGVTDPKLSESANNQRLQAYLAGPEFAAYLDDPSKGAAALNQYRGFLAETLNNYIQDPTQENFDQLREVIYDNSYVFESAEGVGQEAFDQYKQLKQTILAVSQQTNLLEKASDPQNAPASMGELTQTLQSTQDSASNNIVRVATSLDSMITQIESNPKLFPGVDVANLKQQLAELVTRDSQGQITGLASLPPGQEHLNRLNSLWAEVEQVGMQAGLGDDFSETAMARALDQSGSDAAAPTTESQNPDPAIAILKAAPELANHAELLARLSDPRNKALLDAVMSQDSDKVSQFFGEYYTRFFDFSGALGGLQWGGAAIGSTLGLFLPGGNAMAGAIGFGLGGLNLNLGQQTNPTLGVSSQNISERINQPWSLGSSNLFGAQTNTPKLDFLGSSTTANQASGKNMNLMGVSQNDVETLMQILNSKPEARALLQTHGANLQSHLDSSSQANDVKSVIAAKQAFDEAFWSNSASLEDAQASVQSSMTARTQAKLSLEQSLVGVTNALADQNLDPKVREKLEAQKTSLEQSIQAFDAGAELPASTPELDAVIRATRQANMNSGMTVAESVVHETQSLIATQKMEPLLQELNTAVGNGQLQKLLDTLPETQAQQLKKLVSDADGNLSAAELDNFMRVTISSPQTTPEMAQIMNANLESLVGLIRKANEQDASKESLVAYGQQVLKSDSPLPGSPFDMISDMAFMRESLDSLYTTVGQQGFADAANGFAKDALKAMQTLKSQGDQHVDRTELYTEMKQSLNLIKQQSVSHAVEDQLQITHQDLAASAPQAPEVDSATLATMLSASPQTQQALQLIFSGVSESLKADPTTSKILEKVSKANSALPAQLQRLIETTVDPLTLDQKINDLLKDHLTAEELSSLRGSVMRQMDSQLSRQIQHINNNIGSYSRTDTKQAQTALRDTFQAYQKLLQTTQGFIESGQRVTMSITESAGAIANNTKQLLLRSGSLPSGFDVPGFMYKVLPSLQHTNRVSEEQLFEDLKSFLSITDPNKLSERLGIPAPDPSNAEEMNAFEQKAMIWKLAINSVAMTAFLDDPNRAPAAAAMNDIMLYIIQNPQDMANPATRQQLDNLFTSMGKITDTTSRNTFLAELTQFRPQMGQDAVKLAADWDGYKGSQNTSEQNSTQTNTVPADSDVATAPDDTQVKYTATGTDDPVTQTSDNGTRSEGEKSGSTSILGGVINTLLETAVQTVSTKASAVADPTSTTTRKNPPIVVTPAKDPVKARTELWQTVVQSQQAVVNSYLNASPASQQAVQQHVEATLQANREVYQQHRQVIHDECRVCTQLRGAYDQGVVITGEWLNFFDRLMNSSQNTANIFSVMSRIDKNMDEVRKNSQKTASIIEKSQEISQNILKSLEDQKALKKIQSDLTDYLNSVRDETQETQQLALIQLAQQMLNQSISSFYDDSAKKNNQHHFEALERLASEFREKVSVELQKSMAQSSSPEQTADTNGNAPLAAVISQNLRSQLESMLEATQQLKPPMMTDFKRQQILQALFDGDPSNDIKGLLMLTQRASSN